MTPEELERRRLLARSGRRGLVAGWVMVGTFAVPLLIGALVFVVVLIALAVS